MAEVGLVASIITIAGVLFEGGKQLYDLLEGYRSSSKVLSDLFTELSNVQRLLKSLQSALKSVEDEGLPDELQACLQDFKLALGGLEDVWNDLKRKVKPLTTHSSPGEVSKRDRFRLQMMERNINAPKYRMTTHKLTIMIALGLVNLQSSRYTRQRLSSIQESLQNNIESAINRISGQMEGLEIGLQSMHNSTTTSSDDFLAESLRKQEVALAQCLRMCTSAIEAAPPKTKFAINNMESVESAKQLAVVTEGRSGLVGSMSAGGESRQMFLDALRSGAAKDTVTRFFH